MTEQRQLADLPAERAVLGASILHADCWDAAREMLHASDFYLDAHADVFRAFEALTESRTPIDTTTLRGQLEMSGKLARVGGDEFLLALTDTIPTVDNVEHHAARIRDLATLRAVRAALDYGRAELDGAITDVPDFLDRAETLLASAVNTRRPIAEPVSMANAIGPAVEDLRRQSEAGEQIGYKTGFKLLDWYLTGAVPGEVIVCAGRPGMGKTAFALQVAENVARTSKLPVLFQSVEMPTKQLVMRALSSEAGIDGHRFRTGRIHRDDWPHIMQAANRLSDSGVHIDDTPGVTILDVKRNARRLQRKHGGLGLVVIDYLQLLKAHTRGERETQVGDISRECKAMAKELNVPVMPLSQLNRKCEERGKDKRPMISDLRESGAIEQDCDAALLLYRDEVYNSETEHKGIAEVIIGKQRAGMTGTVRLLYRREYTRFENLADDYEPPPEQRAPSRSKGDMQDVWRGYADD